MSLFACEGLTHRVGFCLLSLSWQCCISGSLLLRCRTSTTPNASFVKGHYAPLGHWPLCKPLAQRPMAQRRALPLHTHDQTMAVFSCSLISGPMMLHLYNKLIMVALVVLDSSSCDNQSTFTSKMTLGAIEKSTTMMPFTTQMWHSLAVIA